eukprot:COSAG05_NODE_255_length_12816_cov_13.781631_9_plen_131_part_00
MNAKIVFNTNDCDLPYNSKACEYTNGSLMGKVCVVGQINADQSLPWVAGKYDMWEGKTRRDTLSRYGAKMAFPADLARLPVLEQLGAGAAASSSTGSSFVAPKSFDARTKWAECPSIGTIRNQGAIRIPE